MPVDWREKYDLLKTDFKKQGIDVDKLKAKLKNQQIETPSWGYSNAGTRFMTFKEPGAARNVGERLQDAAQVHKFTGICPQVAIHIPWDKVDDFTALKEEAEDLGVRIGSVNPNLFQDYDYKMGSLTNYDPAIRRKAIQQVLECIAIMKEVDSKILSLWLPDGTNYPGQGNFRKRKKWLEEGLKEIYSNLAAGSKILIEYKAFEPAFYHTDIADWGMAYHFAQKLGNRAQVLVDLGHHFTSANIEHIVAFLIDESKLGGFHFNNKKYADDDLTTGSINPYEVFLIFNEIISAEESVKEKDGLDIAYMVDQMHIIKPKIEAMIQSIMTIQRLYAKALLVDRKALEKSRKAGSAVDGERILKKAYNTDVEPLLKKVREEMGLNPDPLASFRKSGYQEKVIRERS